MSAALPFFELKRGERKGSIVIDEQDIAEHGLGDIKDDDGSAIDPLAKAHTELSRLLWARSLIAKALVGARFQLEVQNGEVMVVVEPAVSKQVVPWSFAGSDLRRFSLFSTNSKMQCPTWDLPSGIEKLGGTCPGAAWAQSTVPDTILQTNTDVKSSAYGEVNAPSFLVEQVKKDWASIGEQPKPVNLQSTVCTYCVAGETLVMVRDVGLRRIEDLVGMGTIEVWSGQGWRETKAVRTKMAATMEVVFSGGRRIRVTPEHRIMTTDGEVEAQDLVVGEHQVDPVLPKSPPFPSEAPLPVINFGEQHHNEKRGEFPTRWSRELGVWLGYMLGDGSFTEDAKYPSLSLVAALHDREDLERLAAIVEPWTSTRPEVKEVEAQGFSDGRPVVTMSWHLKALTTFARGLGLSKRGEVHTPSALWTASRDAMAGYLSGLFSTDGSVARWPARVAVSFSNTSRMLCEEVQQLLFAFGIRSNICEYTSNAQRGYKPLWKVDVTSAESVQLFAERIGFFNARKERALAEGLKAMGPRKNLARPITVESVTSHDPEWVYDLINVGEEQQFIANGVPVHNCYASGGKYGEAVVQFSEVARLALVRAMLRTEETTERLITLLVRVIEETLTWKEQDYKRHRIRPIRVHSSGDFFSPKYAEMWLEVARRLHHNAQEAAAQGDEDYVPVTLWAPTRTHVVQGWYTFWARQQQDGKIPPNFVIRPSAYSVGDPAPFIKRPSPTNSKGTSVLFEEDARSRLVKGQKGDGSKFDWQCGVYALDKGSKTCLLAKAPDGKPGCRACWKFPNMAVDYVVH